MEGVSLGAILGSQIPPAHFGKGGQSYRWQPVPDGGHGPPYASTFGCGRRLRFVKEVRGIGVKIKTTRCILQTGQGSP